MVNFQLVEDESKVEEVKEIKVISKPTIPRKKRETKPKTDESIEKLKKFIEEEFAKVGEKMDYLEVYNKTEALRQLELIENHFKNLNKSKKVMDSFSKLKELLVQ